MCPSFENKCLSDQGEFKAIETIKVIDTISGICNERSIVYKKANSFLVCFAKDNLISFEYAITTMLAELKLLGPKNPAEIPRILCGLKSDLEAFV